MYIGHPGLADRRMEGSKRSQPSLNRVPYTQNPALLLSSKHRLQNHHRLTFKRLLEPPGREEEGGHCAHTWMKLQKPLNCVCAGATWALPCHACCSVLVGRGIDISSWQFVDILEPLTGSSRENLIGNFYIGPHQH